MSDAKEQDAASGIRAAMARGIFARNKKRASVIVDAAGKNGPLVAVEPATDLPEQTPGVRFVQGPASLARRAAQALASAVERVPDLAPPIGMPSSAAATQKILTALEKEGRLSMRDGTLVVDKHVPLALYQGSRDQMTAAAERRARRAAKHIERARARAERSERQAEHDAELQRLVERINR